eukprot:gnl/TRDRNA2_/TRDRNA2_55816_c0_seq1.p1 gnl/TRDRNA2_/TRDRNA2_55816_c0~~gnl/TRDRNA2_/TRDRNA2_55816_c0_seq1.p1  ORF type:complete len:329 (-),score=52.63 gnl/TRDRNA2_/TRDRNA2_55816_c0_seq1:71-973(-)
MRDLRSAFAEPLLTEQIDFSVTESRRGLVAVLFLVGVSSAVVPSTLVRVEQHLAVQEPVDSLASAPTVAASAPTGARLMHVLCSRSGWCTPFAAEGVHRARFHPTNAEANENAGLGSPSWLRKAVTGDPNKRIRDQLGSPGWLREAVTGDDKTRIRDYLFGWSSENAEKTPPRGVVITGGLSGDVYAYADSFMKRGHSLVVSDSKDPAEDVAKLEKKHEGGSGKIYSFTADVSNTASVKKLGEFAEENLGTIHYWVDNKGEGNVHVHTLEPGTSFTDMLTDVPIPGKSPVEVLSSVVSPL